MDSILRLQKKLPEASKVVTTAIAAHHRKLGERHRKRWAEDDDGRFSELWKELTRLSNTITDSSEFDRALRLRYEYAGPRALLQLADHRASAGEDGSYLAAFREFKYDFPYDKPQGVQEKIKTLWDEPLALLRAPTGAGKTDAALLWAQHQIQEGKADRLVIAMPTRFTANALSIATAENLSKVGLHHSTAWYQVRHVDSQVARAEAEMARLLETPITVTTLDHLCISLTGTREDHHATFFNLCHSCVVIDEADFYDLFTQANLIVLLRALRILAVPVLLMSATLPESSCALYAIDGKSPTIYEDETDNNRPRCRLHRYETPVVTPEDMAGLLEPAVNGTPTIIYINTVQRAQRVYEWLLAQGVDPEEIVLYHSRFTEPDKAAIEERLTGMLGKEAWANERQHGIAVLTQIGELSVNISANYMISELCPGDRLVQRIGRLARFKHPKSGEYLCGDLYLVQPHKVSTNGETALYPAPYGTYRSKVGWEPMPSLISSDAALQEKEYSAADFVKIVNDLYASTPEIPLEARQNASTLERYIANNWLILPCKEVDESAEETGGSEIWVCRDIAPQLTVLVPPKVSHAYFDTDEDTGDMDGLNRRWIPTWNDWHTLLLERGVSCYVYEVNRAEQEFGLLEKITCRIGTESKFDTEEIWLVKQGTAYDSKRGLRLRDPAES
jgi:CRISPR-associated endonuclease/helicase Cas3